MIFLTHKPRNIGPIFAPNSKYCIPWKIFKDKMGPPLMLSFYYFQSFKYHRIISLDLNRPRFRSWKRCYSPQRDGLSKWRTKDFKPSKDTDINSNGRFLIIIVWSLFISHVQTPPFTSYPSFNFSEGDFRVSRQICQLYFINTSTPFGLVKHFRFFYLVIKLTHLIY